MSNNAKKLIIVNGVMGVGKTTVCKDLYKELERSVWLDGDWCWMMNPFIASDYNRRMVVENIGFLLRNFLNNDMFEYVIFDWVISSEEIYAIVLSEVKECQFDLFKITLQCNDDELRKRIITDIENGERAKENLKQSMLRQKMYDELSSIKIDTSYMTVREVVQEIKEIIHGD